MKFLNILLAFSLSIFNLNAQKKKLDSTNINTLNGDIINSGGKKNIYVHNTIKKYIRSSKKLTLHDQYEKDVFVKGILIPDTVTNKTHLIFNIGNGNQIGEPASKFQEDEGWPLRREFDCGDNDLPFLYIKIKKNRLYFTQTFIDFDNEQIIGELQFNKWRLRKGNFFDFYEGKNYLEIIDNRGMVVFSIVLEKNKTISLQGYFISKENIKIISKSTGLNCVDKVDPHYKEKALKLIETIQKIEP